MRDPSLTPFGTAKPVHPGGGGPVVPSAGMNRRCFLKLAGSVCVLAAVPHVPGSALAAAPRLEIRSNIHPRAFFFRQAEVLANLRRYRAWEDAMRPLAGIVGKLLPETRTDTVTDRNLTYFSLYKKRNPGKMVLLHLYGLGRLPGFETSGWYAGWWLYRAGTSTLEAVGADATEIRVEDPSRFQLVEDNFGGVWDDLVITGRGPGGLPDFSTAEQVRLTGIDSAAGTLRIERGCYGSSALAWPGGSYVAPHVSNGPWCRGVDKTWVYNLATTAPRDAAGRSVIDGVLDGLAPRFAAGGEFAFLDGIELDVFDLGTAVRVGIDADGDGVEDGGVVGGVDVYALGQIEFEAGLRELLGPGRYLMADGNLTPPLDMAVVSGVELEGVPSLKDPDVLKWSQGLAQLDFYRVKGCDPALSYGMYKLSPALDPPALYSRFRLALAATLLTGTAFTFYDEPVPGSLQGLYPGASSGVFPNILTVWDELVGADAGGYGWLGRPLAPAVHPAESRPDLYEGGGTGLTDAFISHCSGDLVLRRVDGAAGPVLSVRPRSSGARLRLPYVSAPGPDVVLVLDVAADPHPDSPETVPRFLKATARVKGGASSDPLVVPVHRGWSHLVLAFRRLDAGETTVDLALVEGGRFRLRGIRIIAASDLAYREFENGAVFANPSDAEASFDVAGFFPRAVFHRIAGSPDQDPETNNGESIGDTLVLPALDALLVVRR